MDLSSLSRTDATPDELREQLEPVVFELLWTAKDRLSRLSAVEQTAAYLREQGVVGALHTATPVRMGLKATLVLATVEGDMLRAAEGQALTARGDHEEWAEQLAQHAGALVLMNDHGGPRMVGGDEEALARALEEFPEGDGLNAAVTGAAYWGQLDPQAWARAVGQAESQEPGSGSGYTLHREAVLYSGTRPLDAVPGSTVLEDIEPVDDPALADELRVDASLAEGQALWSTPPRPATLMVQDRGGWVALSFTPRLAANSAPGERGSGTGAQGGDGEEAQHLVDSRHLIEEGAVLTASAGLGHSLFPETGPAGRLAELLASDFLGFNEDDEAELVHAIGPVRAAEVIRGLRGMAQGRRVAEGRLAGQEWLGELRDTVEMLGFDPAWVGVLAGVSKAPEPGEPLTPRVADGAMPTGADAAASGAAPGESSGDVPGTAPEPVTSEEAPAVTNKQSQAAYAVVVVAMIMGAAFLFLKPLPWEAANLGVAAVAIAAGVAQLWLTEKRHRREQANKGNE